jgi:hypothetical protein
MKALLAGASLALLVGGTAVHADAKYVTLVIYNKADVNIQVDVVDKISKKTEPNRNDATPGGRIDSKAMVSDAGQVDFTLSIVFRDTKKGSFYRCWDFKSSASGGVPPFNVTRESGRSC